MDFFVCKLIETHSVSSYMTDCFRKLGFLFTEEVSSLCIIDHPSLKNPNTFHVKLKKISLLLL